MRLQGNPILSNYKAIQLSSIQELNSAIANCSDTIFLFGLDLIDKTLKVNVIFTRTTINKL